MTRHPLGVTQAVWWIMSSAVGHTLLIVSMAMMLNTRFFYSPAGWYLILTLALYGLSLASVSQAFAFRPRHSHKAVLELLGGSILSMNVTKRTKAQVILAQ